MKKLLFLFLLLTSSVSRADEGMWIPMLLGQTAYDDMVSKGLKLSKEDIYNINQACLKDAIVLFGGGCTAEVISEEGLIITNHHCGYGEIQAHSTVEKDYLLNGFWAMSREEELPNDDLSVSFLIRMEDVTLKVLEKVTAEMNEADREKAIQEAARKIEKEAVKGTHYEARVRPFYYGNEYYLFVMETFEDVRLVGAPPTSIGSFGGDTDNWVWPRHTGDFSMFRIYANKDNKPAPYAKDNVPYKPKKSLRISLKGVKKGDFTMVYGYPGRTQEYLTSWAVDMIANSDNPVKVNLRTKRLEIMAKGMNLSRKIKLQYSSKYNGVANAWKKWDGEMQGLRRLDAVAKKKKIEALFKLWIEGDDSRKKKYGHILPELEKKYETLRPLSLAVSYFTEAGMAIELVKFINGFSGLIKAAGDPSNTAGKLSELAKKQKAVVSAFFKNYYAPIDQEMMAALLPVYAAGADKANRPYIFEKIEKKFGSDYTKYAAYIFSKSLFASETKLNAFLDKFSSKSVKTAQLDPGWDLMISLYTFYYQNVQPEYSKTLKEIETLMRTYMAGLMESKMYKKFYPDANSTLRVSYGNIADYRPRDGVIYDYYTTLDGVIAKEDTNVFDYKVPVKLKDLYVKKDFGRYAEGGVLNVCFTGTNHTTGGNSGSPVLDANGNLIGLNFDRCFEGTMSDIMYDPNFCRNITLDIRYVLFIIEKYAGAGYLIKEMKVIE